MLWTSDKTLDVVLYTAVSCLLGLLVSFIGLFGFWTTFFVTWVLSVGACLSFTFVEVSPSKKAVFVTGCDSGFGHAIALHLDSMGFRVYAACLQADAGGQGAEALRRKGSSRLHVLQLDVTSQEQISKALEYVKNTLPEDEVLWALVNNAGITANGAVEWVPLDSFRKVADVNLFGVIAMTKAFMPLIRRSKGRVVNVTSVIGCMGAQICAPYITTKYGVEGFSDCLRLEVKQFGVDVCLVEPGSHVIATQILTNDILDKQADYCWQNMDDETKAAYGEKPFRNAYENMKGHGSANIQPVVDAVTEAVTHKYPRARYCSADWPLRRQLFVARHLPEWVYDALFRGEIS